MSSPAPSSVSLQLFPAPRLIETQSGRHRFPPGRITAPLISRPVVRRSARRVQEALASIGIHREVAGHGGAGQKPAVTLLIDDSVAQPQGYRIEVRPETITLTGHDEAGLAYAATTFAQLVEQAASTGTLPCLGLTDWPDFGKRGIMLDISRDKVPTMKTLFRLIDRMAGWKMNVFQLYTEHTFAYANHEDVWAAASPITPDEILELDSYCRDRGIELVPNQNVFGHFERWLAHDAYAGLSECPDPTDIIAWGHPMTVSRRSLCPIDPGSLELAAELLTELLPNFSSPTVNVGCDETIELGYGRSRQECERVGQGRVYLDYLLGLRNIAASLGRRIQFWGDIIINHPELIPELPDDITALVWGYEKDHPFDQECAAFKASGLDFHVCPGTSSWNSLIGRRDNARANLLSAARNGLEHGAKGYLVTDWGDNGHWQPLAVSYPWFAYGAALAWAAETNAEVDLAGVVNDRIFADASGQIGQALLELGGAATLTRLNPHNSTVFHHLLQASEKPLAEDSNLKDLRPDDLKRAADAIAEARARLDSARPNSPDGRAVLEEIRLAADLALHACRQGHYRLETKDGAIGDVPESARKDLRSQLRDLINRFRTAWLRTNRPGGLTESVGRMEKILRTYRGPASADNGQESVTTPLT